MSRKLNIFGLSDFDVAMSTEATFLLKLSEEQQMAISWWVSAKRTRSFPFARVYDSLNSTFKCTVIPIFKDEFGRGDRDYLGFDTISLMSLLNVFMIIGYYKHADLHLRKPDRITNQRYDTDYLRSEIEKLSTFHNSALHWNLGQAKKAGDIGEKAIESYLRIENETGRKMHSFKAAREHIRKIQESRESFIKYTREMAEQAQMRECVTVQPKEKCEGEKCAITITNYLGGQYNFTCDELWIENEDIFLVEDKHTKDKRMPPSAVIKEGLLKMILLTNLKEVCFEGKQYNPKPMLKLTTAHDLRLNEGDKEMLNVLKLESQTNGFSVLFNNKPL